jgi:hypothetical protein
VLRRDELGRLSRPFRQSLRGVADDLAGGGDGLRHRGEGSGGDREHDLVRTVRDRSDRFVLPIAGVASLT